MNMKITLTYNEDDIRRLIREEASRLYKDKEVKVTTDITKQNIYVEIGATIRWSGGKD